MSTQNLNGLVLAGGRSSRMGSDKSQINYHGQPQYVHLVNLLASHCDKVFLSCKTNQSFADVDVIRDSFAIDTPLNGILSAMEQHPEVAWLSVPVDIPSITDDTFRYLISHRDTKKMATCFFDSEGERPEPLLTIWEPAALPAMKMFYEAGGYSPRKFLESHPIKLVAAPDVNMLTNINTTSDMNAYKKDAGL